MRRVHRRSFAVNSFMEDDTGEFLDELDTSFFRRVRMKAIFPSQVYTALLIDLSLYKVSTYTALHWPFNAKVLQN